MKNSNINSIKLSFDLTDYLMSHPDISRKYSDEHVVIFIQGNNKVNRRSQSILLSLLEKGKAVIKATRKLTQYNKWDFEVVNP